MVRTRRILLARVRVGAGYRSSYGRLLPGPGCLFRLRRPQRLRPGFCYAKSHLLTALLRANSPCPGRLCLSAAGPGRARRHLLPPRTECRVVPDVGWYRLDPRGNREGLRAGLDPPREVLPFPCVVPGEQLFLGIWAEPFQGVVDALRRHRTRAELETNLPDAIDLDLKSAQAGCVVEFKPAVQPGCGPKIARSSGRDFTVIGSERLED